MINLRWIGLFLVGLVTSGCTLSPFYHRPALPVASQWPASTSSPHSRVTAAADIGWRQFFLDPQLQKLIELALANNRDLRIASLNVAAARAQYRIQRADLFPTIDATADELSQHTPANIGFPGVPEFTNHEYAAGLGFTSYEVDFFGRIRSLNKRAQETYFSYVETRRSAQITLVAEVAVQYWTWLADQELLDLTQQTFLSQQTSYDLTKQRFDAGVSTALDLSQAQTAVDVARANLSQYKRQAMQDQNALVFLVGTTLPVDVLQVQRFNDEKIIADLPEGLPSDLLERRPDIMAAEHELIAANANIGAARAAFFPSISLTGNFGTASTRLSGLFQEGSRSWVFNPTINLPIFAGGSNRANLDLAHVQKKVQIAQYEKAIQSAFRDVSDALAGRQTLGEQVAAQDELVKASSDSYRLSDMRFRAGIDNYLTVIVSERALYSAQQQLISVELLRLENLVTLYKALGGGWNENSKESMSETTAVSAASPAVYQSTTSAIMQSQFPH